MAYGGSFTMNIDLFCKVADRVNLIVTTELYSTVGDLIYTKTSAALTATPANTAGIVRPTTFSLNSGFFIPGEFELHERAVDLVPASSFRLLFKLDTKIPLVFATNTLTFQFPTAPNTQFKTTETKLICYFIPIIGLHHTYGLPRLSRCSVSAFPFIYTLNAPVSDLAVGTYLVSIAADFDATRSKVFDFESATSYSGRQEIVVSDGTNKDASVFFFKQKFTSVSVLKLDNTRGYNDAIRVAFAPTQTVTGVTASAELAVVLELDTTYYSDDFTLNAVYLADGFSAGF